MTACTALAPHGDKGCAGCHPECNGCHPECNGCHPECNGCHPECNEGSHFDITQGNFTVKMVSLSGVLSTVISPWCAWTIAMAMERPSPVPCGTFQGGS